MILLNEVVSLFLMYYKEGIAVSLKSFGDKSFPSFLKEGWPDN